MAIYDLEIIRPLVESGTIVIACGGGGVPVYIDQVKGLEGVDAIIDKDAVAAVLARVLRVVVAQRMAPGRAQQGGRVLWQGRADQMLIGFPEWGLSGFRDLASFRQLFVADRQAPGRGRTYSVSASSAFRGCLSPDGHSVAYESDDSGRSEIYVQSFPQPGRKWQVSTQGGIYPVWGHDASELFYFAGNKVMRVELHGATGFDVGIPTPLYALPLPDLFNRNLLVATGDGARFLGVLSARGAATPMTVVLNWEAALRR